MPIFKKILQSFTRLFKKPRHHSKKKRKAERTSARKKQVPKARSRPKKLKRVKASARKAITKKQKLKKVAAAKSVKLAKPKAAPAPKEALIGEVTHYFNKIEVIVLKVKSGTLTVGEEIHIQGPSTDFRQKVASLQIESVDVKIVKKGQLAGLKVRERAKEGDKVYKPIK